MRRGTMSLTGVIAALALLACERAHDPEAKPLHEKDGLGRTEEAQPDGACGGAPTGGKITKPLTLPRGCVLHVASSLTIEGGATVTVEPGVHLLFARGAALKVVDGSVEAKGEKGAEIVFDSDLSPKGAKDWDGIELVRSGAEGSTFDHVIIDHAGGGAKPASLLVHSGARASIGVCAVQNDGGAGIRLES